jgi:hypothetical protein
VTKVVNKKYHKPTKDDVYIGRGSSWGNPYRIGQDGTRDEVIEAYKIWFRTQAHLKNRLVELRDKNLVCFCKPWPCHGDFLCEQIKLLDGPIDAFT